MEWILLDAQQLVSTNWILTTYETIRDYHIGFAQVPFSVAVLDEVQKAKNPSTRISLHPADPETVVGGFVKNDDYIKMSARLPRLVCLLPMPAFAGHTTGHADLPHSFECNARRLIGLIKSLAGLRQCRA